MDWADWFATSMSIPVGPVRLYVDTNCEESTDEEIDDSRAPPSMGDQP